MRRLLKILLVAPRRRRWEDNIGIELGDMDCQDRRWTELIQDTFRRLCLILTSWNHRFCYYSAGQITLFYFDISYWQFRWTVIKMFWWKFVPAYESSGASIQSRGHCNVTAVMYAPSLTCQPYYKKFYTCTQMSHTFKTKPFMFLPVVWQRTKGVDWSI